MSEECNAEIIEEEEVTESIHNMMEALITLSRENGEAFRNDDTESGQRLSAAFFAVIDHTTTLIPLVDEIRAVAPKYDFDENTPGNGYRSFVDIVHTFVLHGMKLAREVAANKNKIFFRKTVYMKEVEACSHVLASLGVCLQHLTTLVTWSEPGDLFPDEKHSPAELLARAQNINQYCFYGRCLGFQFCDSMRKALQFICIAMASYSEAYYNSGGLLSKATNSVLTGSKYLLDPELRARRIVNIAQYSNVEFCKSFWQLAETDLMQRLPSLVTPSIAVNQEISIPPQPLKLRGQDGREVEVDVPMSHIGAAPLLVRLLSAHQREGMVGKAAESSNCLPPSRGLIVHCHGGGFVAQSSRSHECYLRDWASRLGVPILSVDYSLAPSAPFPRALEEALYAYAWARQNCHLLGSTGERVVLIGDSAGANLNLGVAMKCIEMGLPAPHGLFLAYIPVLVSFIPSPARLLCLMDPLLPFGFMMRCLKAYAGHICSSPDHSTKSNVCKVSPSASHDTAPVTNSAAGSFEEVSRSEVTEPALKSPSKVSDPGSDTLTTVSLVSQPSSQPEDASSAAARSRRYVAQFLDRYVLDTTRTTRDEEEQEVLFEAPTLEEEHVEVTSPSFSERLSSMATSITGKFSSSRELSREPSQDAQAGSPTLPLDPSELDALLEHDPSDEFRFKVPKDPYLSPYYASDDVLRQLPPTKILSLQLDPCLDDCVMFARKLKNLGNDVHLDVLDSLPHGFLNFALISKEAHEGSKLCVERIRALLQVEEDS